jgi:hypothetical protein
MQVDSDTDSHDYSARAAAPAPAPASITASKKREAAAIVISDSDSESEDDEVPVAKRSRKPNKVIVQTSSDPIDVDAPGFDPASFHSKPSGTTLLVDLDMEDTSLDTQLTPAEIEYRKKEAERKVAETPLASSSSGPAPAPASATPLLDCLDPPVSVFGSRKT